MGRAKQPLPFSWGQTYLEAATLVATRAVVNDVQI
jgi:hypothetical protein